MAKRKKIELTEEIKQPIVLGEYTLDVVPAPGEDLYKCIECGNINETKQCKRCGGSISRKL